MSVVFDSSSTGGVQASTTPRTFNHTIGNALVHTILLVMVWSDDSSAIGSPTVTYNSVSMSAVTGTLSSGVKGGAGLKVFWLDTGTGDGVGHAVSVSNGAGAAPFSAFAASFFGVKTSGLAWANGTNFATRAATSATSDALTLTVGAQDMMVGFVGADTGSNIGSLTYDGTAQRTILNQGSTNDGSFGIGNEAAGVGTSTWTTNVSTRKANMVVVLPAFIATPPIRAYSLQQAVNRASSF